MFSVDFGSWTNEAILYRNKNDKNVTIIQQIFDVRTFGYGGHRTAELKPILRYFQIVTNIDTTKIDKSKWIFVKEK